ncbi:MAG: GntR family transcriptional regulator [Chloroflexota bacterium]
MSQRSSIKQRLHEELESIIAQAELGQRLPSEPNLAESLGVSRATLREAMRTFETQGLIHRRHGVGTFVVHPNPVIESGLEVLESIETITKRLGFSVSMGDLEVTNAEATEDELLKLGLEPGTRILRISRVILKEGCPVAYLVDTLPEKTLSPEEFANGFSGSVLDLLLQRGDLQLSRSRCDVSAVAANAVLARALHVQPGVALLRFESLLYTVDGQAVDYSFSYFLPGYFRFHVVRRVE